MRPLSPNLIGVITTPLKKGLTENLSDDKINIVMVALKMAEL
ncbi:hypothetical protein [Methanosarcina barkeri]|nr:hypothetical protein [Methanosarcina barkeri]